MTMISQDDYYHAPSCSTRLVLRALGSGRLPIQLAFFCSMKAILQPQVKSLDDFWAHGIHIG